ncbi:MAG: hypothetical protein AB1805_13525 [Nitrospirota bacterium]
MTMIKRIALKATAITAVLLTVLLAGLPVAADAEEVTIEEVNEMRAGAGLEPLAGELSTDIPLLLSECEKGIEASCVLLQALIDTYAPDHPPVTPGPDGEAPATRGGSENEVTL